MERDPKWEKVSASVTTIDTVKYGQPKRPEYKQFRLDLVVGDTVCYQNIIVHVDELRDFPELFGFTWDRMVEEMDRAIHERADGQRALAEFKEMVTRGSAQQEQAYTNALEAFKGHKGE